MGIFKGGFFKKLTEPGNAKTSTKSKKMIVIVLSLFLVALVVLLVRVAYLQFIKGEELNRAALRQQYSGRVLTPTRGSIYDTNGNTLAMSVAAVKISVNPRLITAKFEQTDKLLSVRQEIASKLSEVTGVSEETIAGYLTMDTAYRLVAAKVDKAKGEELSAWIKEKKYTGIYVDSDFIRYYPNGSLACHVLGFTGADDQGLVCGLEVALDTELAGIQGRIITEVDRTGGELPFELTKRIDAVNGYNAFITIDINIQAIVTEELKDAVELYGVQNGASCIIMSPKTGDVLAMASYPDFDPNDPYAYPEGVLTDILPENWNGRSSEGVDILGKTAWRNKALSDTYEPGSTFKALVTSMALEEDTVKIDEIMSDEPLTLSGWTIRCWMDNESTEEEENHGEETFENGVINSCNPVFSRVALKMGISTFYNYVDAFGFYNRTGIMLSGEADSIMHKQPAEIDLAVAAFGQRFQITPIQIATAYCALANGGTLCTPRIVKYLTDSNGNVVRRYDVNEVRNVISESTSKNTLEILRKVVDEGTGSNAYVPGYRVAGKTGTSETTETETTGRYVVSFAGIAPSDDPEIVILVVMDHPTVGTISGGVIAAPLAGRVIEKVLSYMGVERRYTQTDLMRYTVPYYLPDYRGEKVRETASRIGNLFRYVLVGEDMNEDSEIVYQYPDPMTPISRDSVIFLYDSEPEEPVMTEVPDVTGMTLEEAFETLNKANLNMYASKRGNVIWQSVDPGEIVPAGTCVMLALRNDNAEAAGD